MDPQRDRAGGVGGRGAVLSQIDRGYLQRYAIEDGFGGAVVGGLCGFGRYIRGWQRVDSLGNLRWVPQTDAAPPYVVVPNGAAGALGALMDRRSGLIGDEYSFVHAVQVDSVGFPVWGEKVQVWADTMWDTAECYLYPAVVDDSEEGAVIAWVRSNHLANEVLVTRVSREGKVLWNPPTVVCGHSYPKAHPCIIKGPAGGYIVVWEDGRNGDWDLYGAYVDSTGRVGIGETPASAGSPRLDRLRLLGCSPGQGPFWLEYRLTQPAVTLLEILDVTGRAVHRSSCSGAVGVHRIGWNGCDDRGFRCPAGVYFCRLRVTRPNEERVFSAKLAVLCR